MSSLKIFFKTAVDTIENRLIFVKTKQRTATAGFRTCNNIHNPGNFTSVLSNTW